MTNSTPTESLQPWRDSPSLTVTDEIGMQTLGTQIAGSLVPGCVVLLNGDLGAGKSVLARAIIHALGHVGRVRSPTYTLVENYDVSAGPSPVDTVAHLDLYRLDDPDELDYLGFDDLCALNHLVLIEWPEKGGDRVPTADLVINIDHAGEDARQVSFAADSR